ncbi:hypothetical protein PV327_001237 [Microctonus hyperodae]|uniref:BZIP domain-containing protein n=1 Tax=Microctonus hyperodae TaxID=165561 RepID=A0AA39G8S8_MICHY|nr:hypothetical protein PV327_001237 [Microctonus hyperodae]
MNNLLVQSTYQRREKKVIPDDQKDEKYYERRKRNNEAAKKSRNARRIREDFIGLRVKILENENGILQQRILLLCEEIESLYGYIFKMQRQIYEIFNQSNYWLDTNLLQTMSFYNSQSCCIRNVTRIIDPYPTGTEINSSNSTAPVNFTSISNFISQLSSMLQTSQQSPI